MHTSYIGQLESYKNTKKGETGMSEKEKGPLEEFQKREGPKDAKKGGARHARGEGGGPRMQKKRGPSILGRKRRAKDAKKRGPRHGRGEGGGPKKKEGPGMSEKE